MKRFIEVKKSYIGKLIVAAATLALLSGGLAVAWAASCLQLADIPLEAMEKEAPGLIMFVIDDSGSMDWSAMCPPDRESGGVFNGYEYIFSNPGDDAYTSSLGDNLENSSTNRMMWMSQWSGYNGMYYDPAIEYTPWPRLPNANVDNPRSNPMNSSNTLDMTRTWHEWGADLGVIIDNEDSGPEFTLSAGWSETSYSSAYGGSYHYTSAGSANYWAQWRATGLDPAITYTVKTRWRSTSSRETAVTYEIYDDAVLAATSPAMNQQQNSTTWMTLATGVSFSSGIGVVRLDMNTGTSGLSADAVSFIAENNVISDVARRHYFTRNAAGNTYLVNILNGTIEYYLVSLANSNDNRERVTADKLTRLSAADATTAGIVTSRTYAEETQNFANWYSFYRRRELTAKNAIARVIDSASGVYIGMISLNGNMTQQAVRPVDVTLDGANFDESQQLLDALYAEYSSSGTPLRSALKRAGEYFRGNYLKPGSFIPQVSSDSYPYFKPDKGGTCQKAFTILFSDGYYNGSDPGVGNTDGDNNTDYDGAPFGDSADETLADVAMRYYENDLNSALSNDVPTAPEDPAPHQHMVTYTVAFGVKGTLDTNLYDNCPTGACPASWPSTSSSTGKIDDMFHAAVNGRGKYIAAGNTTELNEALQTLARNISERLGAGAAMATNSIQLTVGTNLYKATYNTAGWFGEVSALPVDVKTSVTGPPIWEASQNMPAWDRRTILSIANGSGIDFKEISLTATQKTVLLADAPTGATITDVVNYLRGDNSKAGGLLRSRTEPIGDIVHSAPTYYANTVYVGANDGMLHAFDAASGKELFAYIPGLVYEHLGELANPNYSHKFYVDGTATVAAVGGKNVLVCGLGKGGKGIFALDVTDPANMDATKVLWEFTDADMGYTYSRPFIVRTKAYGDVVIISNGYDTADGSGNAVLYLLNPLTGAEIKRFDTKVGGCNGLSMPAPVDVELDGYVDYVYAGDLKGNLWKFDLRTMEFAYGSAAAPMPLISVRNPAGQVQPITAAPQVMLDCNQTEDDDLRGLMVIFGTGQYLNYDDFSNIEIQSFYGVWDWGPSWEKDAGNTTADQDKSLGATAPDRSLPAVGSGIGLLEQKFVFKTVDGEYGGLTDTPAQWYNPFGSSTPPGIHMGWFIDMAPGERSFLQPILAGGAAFLVSGTPSISACTSGGTSGIYGVNACTGGRHPSPVLDINQDGKLDSNDKVGGDYPQWQKKDAMVIGLTVLGNWLYLTDPNPDSSGGGGGGGGGPGGPGGGNPLPDPEPGMFYWRVIGQ